MRMYVNNATCRDFPHAFVSPPKYCSGRFDACMQHPLCKVHVQHDMSRMLARGVSVPCVRTQL